MKKLIKKMTVKSFCFPFKLTKPRSAVLTYHSVNSKRTFEKQILFFKKNNFHFLNLKDINHPEKLLRPKTVLLTFDDGLENHFLNVIPILKKYNVPAVFFIPVNFIGKKFFTKELHCMNWEQIKGINKNPLFEIGSHGLSHKKLYHLSRREIEDEIKESKRILETNLETKINSFAFPFGKYNTNILNVLKEANYSFAFTTKPLLVSKNISLLEIPRFGINDFSSLFLKDIFKKGYELYWKVNATIFNRKF